MLDDDSASLFSVDTVVNGRTSNFYEGDDDDTRSEVDTQTLVGRDLDYGAIITSSPSLDSEHLVLTVHPDDVGNALFTTQDGETLYSSSTRQGAEVNSRFRSYTTTLKDNNGRVLATFRRHPGDDTISLADGVPFKRSSLFAQGKSLSKTIGRFDHNGQSYRWMCGKGHSRINTTLELHTSSISLRNPIARFLDSRRDWSAPPELLVIHKAKVEIANDQDTMGMMDTILLSLIVFECLRRERHPEILSARDANSRARGGRTGFHLT